MAIDTSQGHIVTVKTLVGSKVCQNVMTYFTQDNADNPTAEVADYFEDNIIPQWIACLSNAALLQSVEVVATTPVGHVPYPPAIRFVNLAGTRAGECLPPNVSARIYKQPNVSSSEPSEPPDGWRTGMVRISGISEADQNAGVLSAALVTLLNTLAASLYSLSLENHTSTMYLKRITPTTRYYVPVSFCYGSGILGTQNTRKI